LIWYTEIRWKNTGIWDLIMIDSLSGKGLPTNIQELLKTQKSDTVKSTKGLNSPESRLADQISLSEESQQALETLKNLDKQLTRFLDVLKGNRAAKDVISELEAENNGFLASIESRTALSISQIESIQETTRLSADINDEGELDLILTQTRETLAQSTFSLSTEQKSFLGFMS